MNYINWDLPLADKPVHYRLQRLGSIHIFQRHRALRISNSIHRTACIVFYQRSNITGVSQCCTHEQELGIMQHKQRYLPGPAAVRFTVEMEFVHGNITDISFFAFPERLVRKYLSSAADHGRLRVDTCVACDHTDISGAENRN